MTRKDYILIAEAIRNVRKNKGTDESTLLAVVWTIANQMQLENMRFDPSRFVKACGFNPD